MIKTISICTIMLFMLSAANICFGAAITNTNVGGRMAITNDVDTTSTGGPALNFDPSPNVAMACTTSASAFAISTTNLLTDTTNGMEYACLSSGSGYSNRVKTVAADTAVPAPVSATALPTGTWNPVGGS